MDLFDDPQCVDTTRIDSYLFFAAELPAGRYTRTELATHRPRHQQAACPCRRSCCFKHGDTVSSPSSTAA